MTKADETVTTKAVAILGTEGMMGQGMARNAAADTAVNAWNRTESKLDELAAVENVATFASAREAVDGADVIVAMLSDADATIAAMQGPDGGVARSEGAVWVQMGTLGVEGAERCAELARDREDDPLEAPYMRMKGEAMLRTDFSPSFKLWLATKDARLAAEAGAAAGAEIPGIEAIAAQMEAVAAKHPDEDVAALFLGARED
jgi:3-hydroxyisobutyrate dehydrogenase-like beta-hydroxyacid dehydrogenase